MLENITTDVTKLYRKDWSPSVLMSFEMAMAPLPHAPLGSAQLYVTVGEEKVIM